MPSTDPTRPDQGTYLVRGRAYASIIRLIAFESTNIAIAFENSISTGAFENDNIDIFKSIV